MNTNIYILFVSNAKEYTCFRLPEISFLTMPVVSPKFSGVN